MEVWEAAGKSRQRLSQDPLVRPLDRGQLAIIGLYRAA